MRCNYVFIQQAPRLQHCAANFTAAALARQRPREFQVTIHNGPPRKWRVHPSTRCGKRTVVSLLGTVHTVRHVALHVIVSHAHAHPLICIHSQCFGVHELNFAVAVRWIQQRCDQVHNVLVFVPFTCLVKVDIYMTCHCETGTREFASNNSCFYFIRINTQVQIPYIMQQDCAWLWACC